MCSPNQATIDVTDNNHSQQWEAPPSDHLQQDWNKNQVLPRVAYSPAQPELSTDTGLKGLLPLSLKQVVLTLSN